MTPAEGPDHHLAWERALDEVEAFTYLAEAKLGTMQPIASDPWSAPELGPIPADLVERAREILAHQQRVLERLPPAMERIRQQRAVTQRFAQANQRSAGSVYVDRTA